MGPRIFVLVIAIDKYPTRPLSGCLNDGKAMVHFLKDKLKVPSENIEVLEDFEATSSNILSKFDSHFIKNSKIQYGDSIIFYYAGHGTRMNIPHDISPHGHTMEGICPWDCDSVGPIWSIRFNWLMQELALTKGDNIVRLPLSKPSDQILIKILSSLLRQLSLTAVSLAVLPDGMNPI